MPRRLGVARRGLAAVWLALLLQACGPGTGGTGLPPVGASADATAAGAAAVPAAGSGTAAALAPGVPALALPAREPELVGTIESLDAATLRIAGAALPRASVSLYDESGAAVSADTVRIGAAARAWRVGEGWVVALGR
jgi:hypothetical protein